MVILLGIQMNFRENLRNYYWSTQFVITKKKVSKVISKASWLLYIKPVIPTRKTKQPQISST